MNDVATPIEAAAVSLRKAKEEIAWDLVFEITRALNPTALEREQERLAEALADFLS